MYRIQHKGEFYTVYLSNKLIALHAFHKNMIWLVKENNPNAVRIDGEISELKDFSKITGGKHIYNLIISHIYDMERMAI